MAGLSLGQPSEAVLRWLGSGGGGLHEAAEVKEDKITGSGVFATASIPTNARLVSCPFDLAVTSKNASDAICGLLDIAVSELVWPAGTAQEGQKWNHRMLIGAYLGMHWVYHEDKGCRVANKLMSRDDLPKELRHGIYLTSLPTDDDLQTPLYFTAEERELLRGTNLYGATEDRIRDWQAESEVVRTILKQDGLTWERYRRTSTYLSSRAFPSKLLNIPTPLASTSVEQLKNAEPEPVLLPGLDMFNHSRGQPIVWLSSEVESVPCVSLVTTAEQPAGSQLFNNYGPKSNEELVLGYGFTIEDNPDDVVALKLGTAGFPPEVQKALAVKHLEADKRFLLKRDGKLDPDLLAVLRVIITKGEEDDEDPDSEDEHALHEQEEKGMQLELDVLGTLGQMLDDKLAKLEEPVAEGEVRKHVARMCRVYRQGQMDVLNSTLEALSARIDRIEGMLDQGMGGCACCS